ncbi:MAG TPA: cytochrome c oxidase subunit II [Kofleriaceae bacterium]|nr:cytochrome c oxidase subunit II [Kofleriaceae bacterium]
MNELFRRLLALPEQASTVALGIDVLHYVVISIAVLGAVAITAAVAVLLVRFRRRPGGTPPAPRPRRIPVWVEGVVIGALLAMFVVFWLIGFRQFVHLRTPPRDAMDVYVVGKQWMWTFAYPDGNASTGDLYVPAGRPVRLLMTSRDVIHSFYVPAFRVKQDVLPARTTTVWFEAEQPGTYDILCAEYCGTEHSYMRGRVVVLDDAAWARWAETRPHGEDLARYGERVASERGCLRCHTVDGTPHLGPTWAGVYGTTVTLNDGSRVRADEPYLTESMMDPERHLHAGFPAIMPSYRGLLDAGEVAALVHYIRSLPAHPERTAPPPLQPVRLP